MSAVTDARVALDLDRGRLDPVDVVTAASTSVSRSAADATTRPRFCHGSPATHQEHTVEAAARLARLGGHHHVPDVHRIERAAEHAQPLRSTSRESTGDPCLHLGETFASSSPVPSFVSDATSPHVLVRVWLPDRPGALGLVASRIGAVDGDIVGIDVLERGDSVAVDEFAVVLRDR